MPSRTWPAGAAVLSATGLRSRATARDDARDLARPDGPPTPWTMLGELAAPLDAARLVAALPRLAAAPRGDGHLVVDIPGWKAPELTGAPLRAYLTRLGYDARGWGFGTNTGDPRRDVERLSTRVLELVEEKGQPASLVGWSLGGVIAREVARRHPDAVRRVVTYGTPVAGGARHTSVARSSNAGADAHADRVARRLDASSPIRVPLTVLFSRRDGVVVVAGVHRPRDAVGRARRGVVDAPRDGVRPGRVDRRGRPPRPSVGRRSSRS